MEWYYAQDGQQKGPVSDAELAGLVNSGLVTDTTLVWHGGLANWQPYREVKDGAAPPPVVAPAGAVCCECGGTFPADQVVRYGERYVCAACKPVFLQKLSEGVALAPGATGGSATEAQVLAREYRVEMGDCLTRGWNIFAANWGLIVGVTLVVGLVAMACYAASFLVAMIIPFANALLNFLFFGPLAAGYLWFLLRLVRGEQATMGDAFAGFSRRFGQVVLASLVQGVLSLACLLPVMIIAGVFGATAAMTGGRGAGFDSMAIGLIILLVVMMLLGIAAMAYLNTLWIFSLLLIMDKGYAFWPAMTMSRKLVNKRWGMTFLFLLVGSIISGAGLMACGVGLLVTAPLYYLMKVWLYEDNLRDLAPVS